MSEPADRAPGITATAAIAGEQTLSVADLAALHGVSEAVVARSIEDGRVCVTSRSTAELATEAGLQCLQRAGAVATDLDVIIWVGNPITREPGIQELLGTRSAYVITLGGHCQRLLHAIHLARCMLLSQPELARILVVGAIVWSKRGPAPPTEDENQAIFSDAAAAVLVERGSPMRILGFGAAEDGRFTNYWAATQQGRERLSQAQVLRESKWIYQAALAKCLSSSQLVAANINHLVLPFERGGTALFARWLGYDVARIVEVPGHPTHTTAFDQIFGLVSLRDSHATGVALLGARAIGGLALLAVSLAS